MSKVTVAAFVEVYVFCFGATASTRRGLWINPDGPLSFLENLRCSTAAPDLFRSKTTLSADESDAAGGGHLDTPGRVIAGQSAWGVFAWFS